MNIRSQKHKRVLAIDPTYRGLAFAIMEGPKDLIDWGVKHARQDKNVRCLKKTEELIDLYSPDVIVMEDYAGKGSRRCVRVQKLIRAIDDMGVGRNIRVHSFSREKVRKSFSRFEASTKHEIATAIADRLPELAPQLPPVRKCWMAEDYRMNIFDAVSFALTFFYLYNKQKRAA